MKERKEKEIVKRVDLESYHHTHTKCVWEVMAVLTLLW